MGPVQAVRGGGCAEVVARGGATCALRRTLDLACRRLARRLEIGLSCAIPADRTARGQAHWPKFSADLRESCARESAFDPDAESVADGVRPDAVDRADREEHRSSARAAFRPRVAQASEREHRARYRRVGSARQCISGKMPCWRIPRVQRGAGQPEALVAGSARTPTSIYGSS